MTLRISPRLEAIPAYHPGLTTAEVLERYGVEAAVKLSSNECPYPPSPAVCAAIADQVHGVNRYPDGAGRALRRRLADLHAVEDDQVVLGNGSGEIILLAGQALLDVGTTVIYPEPSFALYRHLAEAAGATAIPVALTADGANDLDTMAAYVDERTRLVVLCTPNNPTGVALDAEAITQFLDALPDDTAVLIDEAYYDFSTRPDRGRALTMARSRPNLMVTRTFSKAFGLSGMRVGYGIGSAAWVAAINKVRPPFNTASVAQAAALAALGELTTLERRVAEAVSERARVEAALTQWGVPFTPSQANFILVGPDDTQARPLHEDLLRRGVIVRDGAALGVPGCVRVSIGTPAQNNAFMDALADVRELPPLTADPQTAVAAGQEGRPTS